MSEVITGVLKFTFGLISNKLRTYGAEKLKDGGLTDQKFRGLIVRELDDIKSKLDAILRKDLSASISFLQQGIQRLNMSSGDSSQSGNPSTSELPKDGKQSQDTTKACAGASSTETKPAQPSVSVENALALANTIGKLKIESNERFELAKKFFEDAGKEATRAFHNAALSLEERILASKVRIASGILQHLEDPKFAVSDCLHFLKELHDLPATKEIFSVYEGFKKDSRAEVAETVTMINLILADFISKFTTQRMAVFDWPMIECDRRVVHPIHYKKESLPNLKEVEITPPWDIVVSEVADLFVGRCRTLTSKGDLIYVTDDTPKKLDKTTGKLQPCFPTPLEDNTEHPQPSGDVVGIAIDENDTLYILSGDEEDRYTLSVYSTDGRNTHHCSLEFPQGLRNFLFITVTKDKNLLICFGHEDYIKVYLCDCKGKLINSSDLARDSHIYSVHSASVSCDNEIIFITAHTPDNSKCSNVLDIYSAEGQLKTTVKFHPSECGDFYYDLFHNQDTKNIIGFIEDYDNKILIEYLSGPNVKLQRSYALYNTNFPGNISRYNSVVHHINGALALLSNSEDHVIFLQKPTI